jgi:plasmid stability protein
MEKIVVLQLKISDSVRERLKIRSVLSRRSMSDLAEELLAEGLDRIESTEKKGS